jgi:hypothetical protein
MTRESHEADRTGPAAADNPYKFERDDALETLARGIIDEAIAKSTMSPRSFGHYSMMAAKQIVAYVLENFERKRV